MGCLDGCLKGKARRPTRRRIGPRPCALLSDASLSERMHASSCFQLDVEQARPARVGGDSDRQPESFGLCSEPAHWPFWSPLPRPTQG